jgi:acylphosphatase
MEVAAHIIVSGMVQGVGFRFFVYNRATRLGLKGFVSNLYNGNVEIIVEGERSLVQELIKEVNVGPRAAHVTDVKVEWKTIEYKYSTFTIL